MSGVGQYVNGRRSRERVGADVIRTPDQRLRVFVSSTLKELAAERDAVRRAIQNLRLSPVMFDSGARPHPAKDLYRSYLAQSHVFIGIYWQSYGWVAPDMQVSGLEDEYLLSADKPRLIYIKRPAPERDPALTDMLQRVTSDDTCCYAYFSTPDELAELAQDDLVHLLSERFRLPEPMPHSPGSEDRERHAGVPLPPTALVGRRAELAAMRDMLLSDGTALVTLTGPGGVGKSRLALQVAADLGDRFRDGVTFVELEAVKDPDLVIPSIARAVGVTESAGGLSLAELLKARLCGAWLLVLDNFEQVLPAAPRVAELLEYCPGLKVLVTSRAPLRLRAERVLPVPPLETPPPSRVTDGEAVSEYPAVQLFAERASGVRPDFAVTPENATAVAELCRKLEGLPLAIELAAARSRMFAPAALLARLERRFDLLSEGARDASERHSTLYRAVDWSYALLNDDEKRLLRCLSAFAGGWSLEAAEAVCGPCCGLEADMLDGHATLLDNSLLWYQEARDGEPRFRMLETIREFAREHLTERGEVDEVRSRHAHFFLSVAEEAENGLRGSGSQEWHRRLEAELDNLRDAMDWGLSAGGPDGRETGLRIASALGYFWWEHGLWHEGQGWLARGLAQTKSVPDAVRAKALARTGWFAFQLGDKTSAIQLLRESVALCRQTGDDAGAALALSNLGTVITTLGDYTEGTALLEEALALRRRLGVTSGIYGTLLNLAIAEAEQGHGERAVQLFTESLALARASDDDDHVALGLVNVAEQHIFQGDLDAAEACYEEAEPIYERHGSLVGRAYVSRGKALLAWRRGDMETATRLLREAAGMFSELGDREYVITNMEMLAVAAAERAAHERAARLLGACAVLRERLRIARQPRYQGVVDDCLTSARERLGDGFAVAWAAGSALDFDEALAYAQGESAT